MKKRSEAVQGFERTSKRTGSDTLFDDGGIPPANSTSDKKDDKQDLSSNDKK